VGPKKRWHPADSPAAAQSVILARMPPPSPRKQAAGSRIVPAIGTFRSPYTPGYLATAVALMLDAILYIARTGCQWRMLPKDFPPFTTLQGYFYDWRDNGLLENINFRLLDLHDAFIATLLILISLVLAITWRAG
jgi:transposase